MTQETLVEIQNLYRKALGKGLSIRLAQKEMIAAIARGLHQERSKITLLEAGTGVGKTLAYLIAAIPIAQKANVKLVVSTATITLQNQIIHKDLNWLQSLFETPLSIVLAKGRRNYLCPMQLENRLSTAENHDLFNKNSTANQLKELNDAFKNEVWSGELEDSPKTIDPNTWQQLITDKNRCIGQSCEYFKVCPYFKAKALQQKADIIVANHDLVLSDLRLGGGIVLPPPDTCLYIFDEAHHLESKARSHGQHHVSNQASIDLLNQCLKLIQLAPQHDNERISKLTRTTIPSIIEKLKAVGNILESTTLNNDSYRFGLREKIPFAELANELAHDWRKLKNDLTKWLEKLKKQLSLESDSLADSDEFLDKIGKLTENAEAHHNIWFSFSGNDSSEQARWIKKTGQANEALFELFVSPLHVALLLKEQLWSRCYGAVLTSATLKLGQALSVAQERLGITDATCTEIKSPFNYQKQAKLYIPPMRVQVQNKAQHHAWLAENLPILTADHLASLVLFTSHEQLGAVCDQLPRAYLKTVLIQGNYSKQELIERHRERVLKNKQSILFGLASLAEGLDLPGKLCTHVIITKLPFMTPDNPIAEAMAEWYQEKNLDPFQNWMLPDAILRLIQATGRLIRTEEDRGIISICDRRIIDKAYGKAFLAALPEYELVY